MSKKPAKKPTAKRKRNLFIVTGVALILLAGMFSFVLIRQSRLLSDAEIQAKIGCKRFTLDNRSTDIFCGGGIELYRKNVLTFEDYIKRQHCSELEKDRREHEKMVKQNDYNPVENRFEEGNEERLEACRVYQTFYEKWFVNHVEEAKQQVNSLLSPNR